MFHADTRSVMSDSWSYQLAFSIGISYLMIITMHDKQAWWSCHLLTGLTAWCRLNIIIISLVPWTAVFTSNVEALRVRLFRGESKVLVTCQNISNTLPDKLTFPWTTACSPWRMAFPGAETTQSTACILTFSVKRIQKRFLAAHHKPNKTKDAWLDDKKG